jgi:hypothetical protein
MGKSTDRFAERIRQYVANENVMYQNIKRKVKRGYTYHGKKRVEKKVAEKMRGDVDEMMRRIIG